MSNDIEALNKAREKARKRDRLIGIIVLCLAACGMLAMIMVYTIPMIWNPMRRPGSMPTEYVLSLTPIGTHMNDVISIVENHRDWRIVTINRERGFADPHQGGLSVEQGRTIVGEQSIRVGAGYFRPVGLLTRTVVTVFYGFDADGYLIDVYVWRSTAM